MIPLHYLKCTHSFARERILELLLWPLGWFRARNALVAGTPCVVANASALSEWVDNESCFGIDFPINLNGLARLINQALDKGADRAATRKWIGAKILDWNDVVEQTEDIYESNLSFA